MMLDQKVGSQISHVCQQPIHLQPTPQAITLFHQYLTANNWKTTFLWPPPVETGGRERHEGPMRFGVSVSQREEMYFKAQRPSERIYHFTVERHSFCIIEFKPSKIFWQNIHWSKCDQTKSTGRRFWKYRRTGSTGGKGLSVERMEEDQHSPCEHTAAVIGDWSQV